MGTNLFCIPNLSVDDDVDDDPNVVLNISDVDPDLDVANVFLDANLEMAGSEVAHRCRFQSHRRCQRRCGVYSPEVVVDLDGHDADNWSMMVCNFLLL